MKLEIRKRSVDGYPARWRYRCLEKRCGHKSLAYGKMETALEMGERHIATYHTREIYANPASESSRKFVKGLGV